MVFSIIHQTEFRKIIFAKANRPYIISKKGDTTFMKCCAYLDIETTGLPLFSKERPRNLPK